MGTKLRTGHAGIALRVHFVGKVYAAALGAEMCQM
jgi:hypothetical protein